MSNPRYAAALTRLRARSRPVWYGGHRAVALEDAETELAGLHAENERLQALVEVFSDCSQALDEGADRVRDQLRDPPLDNRAELLRLCADAYDEILANQQCVLRFRAEIAAERERTKRRTEQLEICRREVVRLTRLG